MTDHELQLKSVRLRKNTLEAIYEVGTGHTGGSLSCRDILNVLDNRILNVAKWHHGVPSDAELKQAMSELDATAAKLKQAA